MDSSKPDSVSALCARDMMITEVVTTTKTALLSEALGLLTKNRIHELPIVEGKDLVGFLSYETLAHRRHVPLSAEVGSFMVTPPTIVESTPAPELAHAMITNDFRGLPVTRGTRLVGIISRTDVVRRIPSLREANGVRAADVMTPEPQVVREDDDVEKARHALRELGERGVPVVDDEGVLTGYVALMDVIGQETHDEARRGTALQGRANKSRLTVKGIVRDDVVAVPATEGLASVARKMSEHGAPLAVVVERQKPVGAITQWDLMQWVSGFRRPEGVFVEVSGLHGEDPSIYEDIGNAVQRFLKRVKPHTTPTGIVIHVTERQKGGGEVVRHTVHVRLHATDGFHTSAVEGWDLLSSIDEALDTLQSRIARSHEKGKDQVRERDRRRARR